MCVQHATLWERVRQSVLQFVGASDDHRGAWKYQSVMLWGVNRVESDPVEPRKICWTLDRKCGVFGANEGALTQTKQVKIGEHEQDR
jgi:hypothetical protein